jgi:hypothetical protein
VIGAKAQVSLCFALPQLVGKARLISLYVLTTICMERTAEQPIIADTSALVSLATETDHNHAPAKDAATQLREANRPMSGTFK